MGILGHLMLAGVGCKACACVILSYTSEKLVLYTNMFRIFVTWAPQ